jgi:hypothetical protein
MLPRGPIGLNQFPFKNLLGPPIDEELESHLPNGPSKLEIIIEGLQP